MRTTVRFRILLIIAAIMALSLSGCAKAPPGLTPAGRAAFQATKVVKALDVMRDFAIDAEAQVPKVIARPTAHKIVTWHRSAVRTIGTIPDGWKAIVESSLTELLGQLSDDERQRLTPYVTLIKTLIGEVIQ